MLSETLRKRDVLKRVPFDEKTLDRMVKQGTFPQPLIVSERLRVWRLRDLEQWEAEVAATGSKD